jgi:hypothetical protein
VSRAAIASKDRESPLSFELSPVRGKPLITGRLISPASTVLNGVGLPGAGALAVVVLVGVELPVCVVRVGRGVAV